MSETIAVGLDLAKNVFQTHGADAPGRVLFRKKLRRDQVLSFFGGQPTCVVAMEACGGAHFWGREIGQSGREVRLIPPVYVIPVVRRQKNDAADAEAVCEASRRPAMRFVTVNSEDIQGAAMVFRIRDASDPAAQTSNQCPQWASGRVRSGRAAGCCQRRLLIIGANIIIIKRHGPASARPGTWLGGMLTRKLPMLARVALANKMARTIRALLAHGGVYKTPAPAV